MRNHKGSEKGKGREGREEEELNWTQKDEEKETNRQTKSKLCTKSKKMRSSTNRLS